MFYKMQLDHLKSFLTVARNGNISTSAKELGTTQPNLGRQMTALSREVGMELFVRHSRGVGLTLNGKKFFDLCQRIVGELEQETALIREEELQPQGTLKIVTGIGSVEAILNKLHLFRSKFPKIHLSFSSSSNILDVDPYQFQIGDADIAYLPVTFSDPDLVQHHLSDMSLRIYASPNYLKEHSMPKTLDDLLSHHLVVFTGKNRDIIPLLNVQIKKDYELNIYSQPFIEVSNGVNMRSALINGLGIGTYFYDQEIMEKKLLVDIFPDMPDHKVPYHLIYHKRLKDSPKVLAFYEFMKDIVKIWERPEN